jgi:hypothetical protein
LNVLGMEHEGVLDFCPFHEKSHHPFALLLTHDLITVKESHHVPHLLWDFNARIC